MPSSQAPPAGATALDPTAVRPDIADARVVRTTPGELRALLVRLMNDEGMTMLVDVAGVDYLERAPRYDVVYHLMRLTTAPADVAALRSPPTRPGWVRMRSASCRRIRFVFNSAQTVSGCILRRRSARA